MMNWKPDPAREACVRRYGNMRQLCGLKRYVFSDGKAAGVEAVDVETGGGLSFTVLPGRGMDISALKYRGIPISYLSKAGVTAPGYHDPRENQWLKSFFAGMLTTCGLTNAGPSCRDDIGMIEDVPFGLHGDISNTAADNLCTREEWVDGEYRLHVSGRMEEGRLHGEHIQLRRTIETKLGAASLKITDEFSNQGELDQALMFFYHINIGHPVLGEGARFAAPSKRIWAESAHAKAAIGVVTISPAETAIIIADIAIKASGVDLSFVDRFSGTLIVTGTVSEVEAALRALTDYARDTLGFTVCEISRT